MCRNFIKSKCLCKCNENTDWLVALSDEKNMDFHSFPGFLSQLGWAWGDVSGICWFCITSLFTSHLEIKQLPSYWLITAVWMDHFVCLTLRLKKIRIPALLFLNWVEACSSFGAITSAHGCSRTCLPPARLGLGLSGAIPGKYARVMFQGLFSDCWRLWIFGRGVFSILFKQQAQPTLSWSLVKFWWNVTPCPSCLCSFLVLTAKAAVSVPEKWCLFFKVYTLRKPEDEFSQATADTLILSFGDVQ